VNEATELLKRLAIIKAMFQAQDIGNAMGIPKSEQYITIFDDKEPETKDKQ
jgi:hypothetical protein